MRIAGVLVALAAGVIAAAVPAAIDGLTSQNVVLARITFIFALPFAAVGMLLWLVLRRWWRLTWWRAAIAGFLIGAVPFMALLGLPAPPDNATINGLLIAIDGKRTAAGWWFLSVAAAQMGGIGAAGGFAFWLVLRLAAPQLVVGRPAQSPSPARAFWRSLIAPSTAIILAMAATIVLVLGPSLPVVGNCATARMDKGQIQGPVATLTFDSVDADALADRLEGLDGQDGWWAAGRRFPSGSSPKDWKRLVSLCRDVRAEFTFISEEGSNQVIFVYGTSGDDGWREQAEGLAGRLAETWPGRVHLTPGRP